MKVFIADDSARLREQLVGLFSGLAGIEIIGQAQAAQEALHAIRRLRPDVVILDIHLASGSGIDVLEKTKQEGIASVVIMLTNYASPPYRERCLKAGADFFLDKSTELKKLTEIIQGLLEQFNSNASTRSRSL